MEPEIYRGTVRKWRKDRPVDYRRETRVNLSKHHLEHLDK